MGSKSDNTMQDLTPHFLQWKTHGLSQPNEGAEEAASGQYDDFTIMNTCWEAISSVQKLQQTAHFSSLPA